MLSPARQAADLLGRDVVQVVHKNNSNMFEDSYKQFLSSLHVDAIRNLSAYGDFATDVEFITPYTVVNADESIFLIEEDVKAKLAYLPRIGAKRTIRKSIKSVFTGEMAIGFKNINYDVRLVDVGLPLTFTEPALCMYWLFIKLTYKAHGMEQVKMIKTIYPQNENTYCSLEYFAKHVKNGVNNANTTSQSPRP